jgi:hypothetical protein
MKSMNYISMKPVSPGQVRIGGKENASINGLTEDGKTFALYLSRKETAAAASIVEINLPAGSYKLTWVDTKGAGVTSTSLNGHTGEWAQIKTPDYSEDIALKVVKTE